MNPFEILGISPAATLDEVKAAFRKMAMEHHPDRGGDAEKFKKMHAAYNFILKNFGNIQQHKTEYVIFDPFAGRGYYDPASTAAPDGGWKDKKKKSEYERIVQEQLDQMYEDMRRSMGLNGGWYSRRR